MQTLRGAKLAIFIGLLPALIIYLGIAIVPIGVSLYYSLMDWNGIGSMEFVGLDNFTKILGNNTFWLSVKNNVIIMVTGLIGQIPLGLLLALLLNRGLKGSGFFRTVGFMPVVISSVMVSLIWGMVYNTEYGMLNNLLGLVGLDSWKQNWLGDDRWLVVTVFLGALASYFLSRFQFRLRGFTYGVFLLGMLVPIHATLIPIFLIMQKLHLLDTHLSLILPYTAFHLSLTIIILEGFMRGFPKDLEESGVMDGAGIFRIFWSIILPITRPAMATVIILNFIYNWNEYLFALVLISSSELKTLPLGLANFVGIETANLTLQMAALTMALIPIIIFYFEYQVASANPSHTNICLIY